MPAKTKPSLAISIPTRPFSESKRRVLPNSTPSQSLEEFAQRLAFLEQIRTMVHELSRDAENLDFLVHIQRTIQDGVLMFWGDLEYHAYFEASNTTIERESHYFIADSIRTLRLLDPTAVNYASILAVLGQMSLEPRPGYEPESTPWDPDTQTFYDPLDEELSHWCTRLDKVD